MTEDMGPRNVSSTCT